MTFSFKYLIAISFALLSFSAQANLIISEYIEGSGYNKAVEFYNPSESDIDLSDYQLEIYFNGNSQSTRQLSLVGTIFAKGTWVVAHDNVNNDAALIENANQLIGGNWFNGDDALILRLKTDHSVVDSFGQVGFDPGSQWGNTKDNNLRKTKAEADVNPLDAFDTSLLWQAFSKNDYSDLNSFNGNSTPGGGDFQQTNIHSIQGDGDLSPMVGEKVLVTANVTLVNQQLNGFYIQHNIENYDQNINTSEGVFVYYPFDHAIEVGDRVEIKGSVAEYYGQTQLADIQNIDVLANQQSIAPSIQVSLPVENENDWEKVESMLVHFNQDLTVVDHYNLSRYGSMTLASERLMIPTNVVLPGAPANELQQQNNLKTIVLDDYSSLQNPAQVMYPAPGLSANNTVRTGDAVINLQAVVFYAFGQYGLHPATQVQFDHKNLRPLDLDIEPSSLRVASFNVLNYFVGPEFPTARGADNIEEFNRQQDKIVNAIIAMDADVVGLMEIENNPQALDILVAAVNDKAGSDLYQSVNTGVIGSDAITVAFIYKPENISAENGFSILDESVDARFNTSKNRPALAVNFTHLSSDKQIWVAVNHLKSKGSSCDALGDMDLNDGQGNCNQTRTQASLALADWIASKEGEYKLIIGDLNAYASEDPITALKDNGYSDLINQYNDNAYSYVFKGQAGYLDHALANQALEELVVDTKVWHINSDEPRALDYNLEFKSFDQQNDWYDEFYYRSSDHDPVVVAIEFSKDDSSDPDDNDDPIDSFWQWLWELLKRLFG